MSPALKGLVWGSNIVNVTSCEKDVLGKRSSKLTSTSFFTASVQFEFVVRQSFEILALFSIHSTSNRSLFSVVESGILGFGIRDY